ncbi:MAG: response regulator [Burkholderiales bacterium]|nr:response regulator [Nitrosomonas sp.]MCP5275647.1 response regulator [Burkholderiales bacterium]
MNVLIVEDNHDIAASIYDYLGALGYAVDVAGDGELGLHLALTKDYDVIILDLGLPGIDGYEICQRLRQAEKRSVPVIILTARDSLESRIKGFDSGADDYLTKPFSLKELAARVKIQYERVNPIPTDRL